jgi:hypothetical protein
MAARPETLIHGQEVRVNTGWPSPHLVKSYFTRKVMRYGFIDKKNVAPGGNSPISLYRRLVDFVDSLTR